MTLAGETSFHPLAPSAADTAAAAIAVRLMLLVLLAKMAVGPRWVASCAKIFCLSGSDSETASIANSHSVSSSSAVTPRIRPRIASASVWVSLERLTSLARS